MVVVIRAGLNRWLGERKWSHQHRPGGAAIRPGCGAESMLDGSGRLVLSYQDADLNIRPVELVLVWAMPLKVPAWDYFLSTK